MECEFHVIGIACADYPFPRLIDSLLTFSFSEFADLDRDIQAFGDFLDNIATSDLGDFFGESGD